jgi:anaerobic dimethyl sulfoxide reductase subunit C (anchor subunit)
MEIQWPLVIFTLCICLGAGVFALQGVFCVAGKGRETQLPAVIFSAAAVVVGGIASFLHLHHWDRAFNGFGQLSSGITQELISTVVLFIVMAVFFALGRKGLVPKWLGVVAIFFSLVALVTMTTSYIMPARLAWASPLLYVFYIGQAFVFGAAVLWLIGSLVNTQEAAALMSKCTAVGGVVVVISLVAYALFVGSLNYADSGSYLDMTAIMTPRADTADLLGQLLTGSYAVAFWCSLVLGGLVPAVLGLMKWKGGQISLPLATVCIICALAGGVAFRAVLYLIGYSVYPLY